MAKSNGLMDDNAVIFGIAHDDPQTTPPGNCRYDVGILLTDTGFPATDSVRRGEIAGGSYAVFTPEHTAEAMGRARAEIFPALSERGYLADPTRPILERYAAKRVAEHRCEICIPIEETRHTQKILDDKGPV